MTEGKKLEACDVGQNAPRSCTNVCCLMFFCVAWGLLIVIAVFSFTRGDIRRLSYGVDYEGNVCSRGSPDLVFPSPSTSSVQGSNTTWSARQYLWFPIGYTAQNGFSVNDARKLGVCVAECPQVGEDLAVYHSQGSNATVTSYYVAFNSSVVFRRCMPNFLSYDCSSTGSAASEATCNSLKSGARFAGVVFSESLATAYEELVASWWILFIAFAMAVILCLLWLFALRRLVIPIVAASLFLLLAAIGVVGYLLFREYQHTDDSEGDTKRAFLAGSIIVWVGGVVFIALLLFFRKDILIACQIIEEAVKVPFAVPSTTVVPIVVSLFIIPVAVLCLFTAAATFTAAKSITATVPTPSVTF